MILNDNSSRVPAVVSWNFICELCQLLTKSMGKPQEVSNGTYMTSSLNNSLDSNNNETGNVATAFAKWGHMTSCFMTGMMKVAIILVL